MKVSAAFEGLDMIDVLKKGQKFVEKLAKTLHNPTRLTDAYRKFKVKGCVLIDPLALSLFTSQVHGICWSDGKWLVTVPGAKHKIKRATFSDALAMLRNP